MKNLKKAIALLLALAMVMCLAACGSFEKKMAKSAAKMSRLDSIHMDVELALDMGLSIMGETMDMDASVKAGIDMNTEPLAMLIDMNVGAMGFSERAQVYMADEGGQLVAYGSDDGGETWERREVEAELTVNGLNTKDSLVLLSKWAESFEEAGQEQINGSTATKYTGELTAEDVKEAMELSGVEEAMESGLKTDFEDMLDSAEMMPVSIWIDNKSSMVVRMEVDMTAAMQGVLTEAMEQVGGGVLDGSGLEDIPMEMDIRTALVSIEYSQFDKVGTIEPPAGIK